MSEGDQGRTEHEVEIDRLSDIIELLKADVGKLRLLLFLRHDVEHYSALYGDDGELQCSVCLIDFKRMSPDGIEARWQQMGLEKLAQASSVPSSVADRRRSAG